MATSDEEAQVPRVAPTDARAAVEAALLDPADTRSRAQLARDHGVSARSVSRWAAALGLSDPFSTADTRKATESARDRRRALRSQLADAILTEDIPLLRAQLHGTFYKTVLVGQGMGEQSVQRVAEDDANVASARQRLVTATAIGIDKTIAIDKHDEAAEDDNAGEVLDRLFAGLDVAYRVIKQRGLDPDEDDHEDEDEAPR